MKNKLLTLSTICMLCLLISQGCSNKKDKNDKPVVKVGNKNYLLSAYRTFQKMRFIYPVQRKTDVFPGSKEDPTLFVETILLHKDAKKYRKELVKNIDYSWRDIYLYGYLFQKSILIQNMGFTTETLEKEYYKKEKETPGYFNEPSFSVARKKVAEYLFVKKYPPDSSYGEYFQNGDFKTIEKIWLKDVNSNITGFFRKYYYKQRYGKEYPMNPDSLLGPNGIISDEELHVVLGWLPRKKLSEKENKIRRINIARMMVGWKLFAHECKKSSFSKTSHFKELQEWYSKFTLVSHFANSILSKSVAIKSSVDSVALKYLFWDYVGNIMETPGDDFMSYHIDSLRQFQEKSEINGYIMERRKKNKISFSNNTITDYLDIGSEGLYALIDSLMENDRPKKAKGFMSLLTTYLAVTEPGKVAYKLLAGKYMEKSMYLYAIKYYRSYLISAPEAKDKDQIYFNIGYMYDKLGLLELASINLKFIFKYAPESPLIKDVEFLSQHLGEPLPPVEELNAEARRRGQE